MSSESNKNNTSSNAPAQSGPPITEEERARRAAAEDALDKDLNAARQKKLREQAYEKRRREQEAKKEAERLEEAHKAQIRHQNAAETQKKLDAYLKEKAEIEAELKKKEEAASKNKGPKKNAAVKYFNNTLSSMAAGRALAVFIAVLLVTYAGAHIYINAIDNDFYSEVEARLTGQNRLVTDSSIPYTMPSASLLSYGAKTEMGLAAWLADTDKDGLSDYLEIHSYGTDPLNKDSDGDGVEDGAEIRAGLDPLNKMSDGVTPDGQIIKDVILTAYQVVARVRGVPKTAEPTFTKLDNNSIQGTPGLVSYAYEFYSVKSFDSCELTFTYTDEQLKEKGFTENALSVYRFNADSLSFEKVTSELNVKNNSVSAHIDSNGIYALCDSSILAVGGQTNIFFLIDNSGSMYPEELCPNSEENDVEFKRLDFAVNLMDMLGRTANYGAGEFSGSYANIVPISDDFDTVEQKISDIRNKNQTFSGTEIAGAIMGAVNEFSGAGHHDRNYIILLTDGMPSTINAAKEQAAVDAAVKSSITIFTIGLGKYIDSDYLYGIAAQTNGQFFQASNADALENIYDKIRNFMSYNQVTIEEETGKKGYIVADSGFNVLRDGIGYSNFRSDFAPNGADVGIAGLIRAYYTGELNMSEDGYTDKNGKSVPGYNIGAFEDFADGKADLKSIEMNVLKSYNEYMAIKDKWDYKKIKDGVLQYNDDTRSFINEAQLKIFKSAYAFEAPEESSSMQFLRRITFNNIKKFDSYESVLIDSSICEGSDAAAMDMLRWYCYLINAENKCHVYDFGYEGDAAFEALLTELSTGSPAVIAYGGSAMNAVRLMRDASDPNSFVLDAYDCNSPDRSTRINITRTPVYEDGSISYQYAASRGIVEEPLRIFLMT